MVFRLLKIAVIACGCFYAAHTLGVSSPYRSNSDITLNDFSESVVERWYALSGPVEDIRLGGWESLLLGGRVFVRYRDNQGMLKLLVTKSGIDWGGCSGKIHFDLVEEVLLSTHSTGCLSKRHFISAFSELIREINSEVEKEIERDESRRAREIRNMASWEG